MAYKQEKIIKISIDPLGKPTFEAEGFTGGECLKATKAFEDAASGKATLNREYKPEFYQQNDNQAKNELRY